MHRIGRTGRAGQSGTAITFVSKEDNEAWSQVQKLVKEDIDEYPLLKETPKTEKKAQNQTPNQRQQREKTKPMDKHPELPKGDTQGFGDHIPEFMRGSTPSPS